MKTTYRVEHKARVSRVIATCNGESECVREFFASPPLRRGEQRGDAVLCAQQLRATEDVR